jgi:hypothetical protein
MSVLVGTSDGYHVFTSSGKHLTALVGHAVESLTPAENGSWLAIVDRHEIWRHAADGSWNAVTKTDAELSSLLSVSGELFAGTFEARLLQLRDDELVPVDSFDHISNRDEWHQVGPALNVRSMTATCDERTVLANVHVGGIQRSTDLGASWEPTIAVNHDVHEVRAHPSRPDVVMAAAAVGLCVSTDAGATWSVEVDGLPVTYARAINFLDDTVLISISDGPFASRSAIYRRPVDGGTLERIDGGLGDELAGNVDTRCLATSNGRAALADRDGSVWVSANGTDSWERLAEAVGSVSCVALS